MYQLWGFVPLDAAPEETFSDSVQVVTASVPEIVS